MKFSAKLQQSYPYKLRKKIPYRLTITGAAGGELWKSLRCMERGVCDHRDGNHQASVECQRYLKPPGSYI